MGNWNRTRGAGLGQHTSSAGTADHQTELNTLLDILLAANLNLPAEGSRVSSGDFFLGEVWGSSEVPGEAYRVESRRHGGLGKRDQRTRKQEEKKKIPRPGISREEEKGETLLRVWTER